MMILLFYLVDHLKCTWQLLIYEKNLVTQARIFLGVKDTPLYQGLLDSQTSYHPLLGYLQNCSGDTLVSWPEPGMIGKYS